MKPGILYLHGFLSSPASWKASLLSKALAERGLSRHFFCPALPPVPNDALMVAENIVQTSASAGYDLTLVGSSLGAYYATILAERHRLRAVLINPVVTARKPLADYLGAQTNFQTGEPFELRREHLDQLEAMAVSAITPERYLLFAETGDQVLDYHDAMERYLNARQYVFEGGDHTFTRFPEVLPTLFDFCGW